MNLTGTGSSASNKMQTPKATLNPNAAEFVPFALRSPANGVNVTDTSSKFSSTLTTASSGKAVLDISESSFSNNSDDEVHQYWRHQLPDDITPDFNVMGSDDIQGLNGLSLSSLSLNDANEVLAYSQSSGISSLLKDQQVLSSHPVNGNNYGEKVRYRASSYGDYPSHTGLHSPLSKPWDKQILGTREGEAPLYNGNSRQRFLADMRNEQFMIDDTDANPLEFLASQFPGFATDSLAEVYFTNGGDLNLTTEMLTQLELQVDGGLNQTLNSKALSSPNLNAMDFPALSVTETQNGVGKFVGDDIYQNVNPYRSSLGKENTILFRSNSSIPSRSATGFVSAVRKMPPQDSNIWKYDRNGSSDTNIGSSRSPQLTASSFNSGQVRNINGDRFRSRGSTQAAPVWLETGEAVANMYSETREEARDHARVRNAYFEQARQAYLLGNKALAKDLSGKGQLHNLQMKAAHGKAQESIYRQRNQDVHSNGRERTIDLHGLHVSEAIHVLKRELAVMRNAARSAGQRMLVYVCVGTGHHTRGSRTPARLPISVQRYLLEEEGLDFSEPQPGLLRVVVY